MVHFLLSPSLELCCFTAYNHIVIVSITISNCVGGYIYIIATSTVALGEITIIIAVAYGTIYNSYSSNYMNAWR